jgi:hypothetical protein
VPWAIEFGPFGAGGFGSFVYPGRCPGLSGLAPSGLVDLDRLSTQGGALGCRVWPLRGWWNWIVCFPRAVPWAIEFGPFGAGGFGWIVYPRQCHGLSGLAPSGLVELDGLSALPPFLHLVSFR